KIVYSGEAAYSSMTILKNGEIGLFFEKDNYTKNVFTSFSLKWLLDIAATSDFYTLKRIKPVDVIILYR
ncbi:MAG: exo-alpha-sialidase, partial [Cryomorphaceae bacterium]|nr:exo-alpha-sialidase [Cryomorphaceae bacterium]